MPINDPEVLHLMDTVRRVIVVNLLASHNEVGW